ncbi:MAG: efflux RND transporter periplasmic adaptor subunit [Sphingomonadales bacterium]|nr:efflux RND transporter periplasmic adaptor subunit [Sphingomonadales bacterium]
MTTRARWTAAVLALAIAGCGKSENAEKPVAAPPGPRVVLQAQDAPDWQDVSAEVATVDQAQVMARMPGVLSTLTVRAGDFVRRGQVIGRVSDSAAGGSGMAAAAAAQAGLAQAELARVRFLTQNGVYAKARLEQAEAAARAASAQAGTASAAQVIAAPAAGRVLHADIPLGSTVAPGMVVAVIASGPVVLRLQMPESLAGKVHAGSQVRAQLGSGEVIGTVNKLYPAVTIGQVTADVSVPGLDANYIGRRVAARIEAGSRKKLLVARAVLTTRYGIDYATVLQKDGSAATVPVQTAPADGDKVEILSGLAAGDMLIGASK